MLLIGHSKKTNVCSVFSFITCFIDSTLKQFQNEFEIDFFSVVENGFFKLHIVKSNNVILDLFEHFVQYIHSNRATLDGIKIKMYNDLDTIIAESTKK